MSHHHIKRAIGQILNAPTDASVVHSAYYNYGLNREPEHMEKAEANLAAHYASGQPSMNVLCEELFPELTSASEDEVGFQKFMAALFSGASAEELLKTAS